MSAEGNITAREDTKFMIQFIVDVSHVGESCVVQTGQGLGVKYHKYSLFCSLTGFYYLPGISLCRFEFHTRVGNIVLDCQPSGGSRGVRTPFETNFYASKGTLGGILQ